MIQNMVEETINHSMRFGRRSNLPSLADQVILSSDEEEALEILMDSGRRSGGFNRKDDKMLNGDLYEYAKYLQDMIGDREFRQTLKDEISNW